VLELPHSNHRAQNQQSDNHLTDPNTTEEVKQVPAEENQLPRENPEQNDDQE
jgi:hypothetical protein